MINLIDKLIIWFNLKTGLRFMYYVRLEYYPHKTSPDNISNHAVINLTHKKYTLDHKERRRIFQSWVERIVRGGIKGNGDFKVNIDCYLGYFNPNKKFSKRIDK